MSDLPVPAASHVPSMAPDHHHLASKVSNLGKRVGDFEGRMDRMVETNEVRHRENSTRFDNLFTEMRNGFAEAKVSSAQQQQTKWPVLFQAASVVIALGVGLGVPCVVGLFIYINMSISRVEATQQAGLAKIETAQTASIAKVEGSISASTARIEQGQRDFEKEARQTIVPRAEVEKIGELRTRGWDALERRIERLEAKSLPGR